MNDFIIGFLIVAAFSYLLGSFNFAIIVSRLVSKDDVRKHGSGNAGMTNMLRTYGKLPATVTAAGDFLKAVIAIVLARLLFAKMGITLVDAGYLSGLFVLLGHVYPLYFGFRGGKGVMTSLGIVLAVNPLVFLIIAVIFVPFVFIAKIVSLASVLGAVAFPVITCLTLVLRGKPAIYETVCALVISAIILVLHHGNIGRLLAGTERKFGAKKPPDEEK